MTTVPCSLLRQTDLLGEIVKQLTSTSSDEDVKKEERVHGGDGVEGKGREEDHRGGERGGEGREEGLRRKTKRRKRGGSEEEERVKDKEKEREGPHSSKTRKM